MLDLLADALDRAAGDDRVRAVVLTGAGRGFLRGRRWRNPRARREHFGPMADRAGRVARQIAPQRATGAAEGIPQSRRSHC